MRVKFVEVGNFRRLRAARVDFSPQKTVFVGANNSGKTSAMEALRYFLLQKPFSMNDFTLSDWPAIDKIGYRWENPVEEEEANIEWDAPSPLLDVWLEVTNDEVHYVQKLLPTLDWQGGDLGVRLKLEPNSPSGLRKKYLDARDAAKTMLNVIAPRTASPEQVEQNVGTGGGAGTEGGTVDVSNLPEPLKITLWPESLTDFLQRRPREFVIRAYILDPDKRQPPINGVALPQSLPDGSEPLEGDPFKGLLQIDEINAQRGFGEINSKLDGLDGAESSSPGGSRRLSDQLRAYYEKHLDPYDNPDASDLLALSAFEEAQKAFNDRLKKSFADALKELEELGYPGFTDPRLNIATRFRPIDSLRHDSAVQFIVPSAGVEGQQNKLLLPEGSNGLGFQNLISMIFRLMSFRDAWLRVGKVAKKESSLESLPPLHLVLIEEPEAHLHAQVQQVFIHRAYDVLRNHKDLKDSPLLTTQLVVSTHSSHIAHESDFKDLRYFRRLPASEAGDIPTSSVINMAEVFGDESETQRFVTRYLKVTHCDLFFADGAILVEGPAERILVPHFVRENAQYKLLTEFYLTWLEIGGSHAHRLKSLIETLGLVTLIITDIDAKNADDAAVRPQRGQGLTSRNPTLKDWVPGCSDLDELLDKDGEGKVIESDGSYAFGVRVAYQSPVRVDYRGSEVEALANTFEDALVFQNLELFSKLSNTGLIAKFKKAIGSSEDIKSLGEALSDALKNGTKAELALDLLELNDTYRLQVPRYIDEGLRWLASEISCRQREIVGVPTITELVP
jgi:predicted ATP-dependent endonuclease of OLD family